MKTMNDNRYTKWFVVIMLLLASIVLLFDETFSKRIQLSVLFSVALTDERSSTAESKATSDPKALTTTTTTMQQEQDEGVSSPVAETHRDDTFPSKTSSSQSVVVVTPKIERIYYINLNKRWDRKQFMERWLSTEAQKTSSRAGSHTKNNHKAAKKKHVTTENSKKRMIPYERISAVCPDDEEEFICQNRKQDDALRCRGIVGLIQSNLKIMKKYNTSGLTLVMEDDYQPTSTPAVATVLHQQQQQSTASSSSFVERVEQAIVDVPNDWDVIRLDCKTERPRHFVKPLMTTKTENGTQVAVVFETKFASYPEPPEWNINMTGDEKADPEDRGWYCGGTHAVIWREESVNKLRALWSMKPYNDIDCALSTPRADRLRIKSYCVNRNLVEHALFESDIHPKPEVLMSRNESTFPSLSDNAG